MKQTNKQTLLKNLLKTISLIIYVAFFLQGCRNETLISEKKTVEQGIQKQISYQELLMKIGNENYTSLKNNRSKTNLTFDDFEIDKNKIIEVSNEKGDIDFSMRVIPKSQLPNASILDFYNLYIHKRDNKLYQTIIKFRPSVNTLLNGFRNFKADYEIITSNYNNTYTNNRQNKSGGFECGFIYITIPCDNGFVHPEGDGPGEWCDVNGSHSYHVYTCSNSGGGNGTGTGTGTGTIGEGAYIGNNGNNLIGGGMTTNVLIMPSEGDTNLSLEFANFKNSYTIGLSPEAKIWLSISTNSNTAIQLFWHAYNNNYSQESINLVNKFIALYNSVQDKSFLINNTVWCIEFFAQNPNTTIEQFQNWFMGQSEGQDGEYDLASEIAFQQQQFQKHSLPSMTSYENAFPSKPNATYPNYYRDAAPNYEVYNNYVGGRLKQLFNLNGGAQNTANPYYNTCAVRQSYAHNKLGIMIPFQHNDHKGDNNWNYILTASKMGVFLEGTYGAPTYKLEGSDVNNPSKIAEFLKGKTGIYLLINNDREKAGYTGHTDMIKNSYVSGGAALNPKGGIKYIYIWELK